MSLSMKGDSISASKFLKIYEALSKVGNQDRPSTKRATSYTPYFDKNIQELRYPIPLTIFNKDWQNKAMTYHVKKRTKSTDGESKTDTYNGLPYADEWLLDYGEWCIHFNGFVNALKGAKFNKFVEWTLAHKANVEKVMNVMGWMTALKYDMRVREEALINRVEVDGKVAPPDISEYNLFLAEECFGESGMREELLFKKNPYVEGGERYGWDPATGKPPKKGNKKTSFGQEKSYQKWNNNPTVSGSGGAAIGADKKTNEKKKFKPGYQGMHFDPQYAEKKAAAKSNQTAKACFALQMLISKSLFLPV
ncbi:uncharacterized protein MELLADRAFT_102678 [Melampsora larici-populina 98AG31]|uniref:Uncharacterized protein n=1 Tax=Melampsora larici-populina (strain 98AG31 / pathotype 3-4-7) TaxID=747676 RepID=F4R916_MELLP|nr:uncharacterized protein MELLADRAFT_102678 [Melampsora larici-populina 98AG31]EGG10908.1 hypothetical protein MELLADRAFT_102678 [Melampsora larici-populina 98AG31]